MQNTKLIGLAFGILFTSLIQSFCQTNLQFTSATITDEHAVRLTWRSQPNHVYEIDEADSLIDTNTGTVTWRDLYDDYPSQGTNTFWLDTGNYFLTPPIVHPKNAPMRFYRIVDKGQDDLANDEPSITIISPTNGSVASGLLTVTVNPSADQGKLYPKLYVDGQVMWPSEDGSNYVLNTCEWENGSHTIFATVNDSTGIDGPSDSLNLIGHGVSPFVGVTFSNLISRISFSRQFFHSELGQTQTVTATFAANCDWKLTIRDAYSNAVRTATGSGSSMSFGWDGKGDDETNIPLGVYYYYVSAQPNGEPMNEDTMANTSAARLTTSPIDNIPQLYAVSPDDSDAIPMPLALYPPGMDTNNLIIFEATPAELRPQRKTALRHQAVSLNNNVSPDDTSSPQDGPPAPLKSPNPPCNGTAGKFAIGYQLYNGNGTNEIMLSVLADGSGIPNHDVNFFTPPSGSKINPKFSILHYVDFAAIKFFDEMEKGCWDESAEKANDQLQISDLQGSGSFFNQSDIGLLILHGTYGTSTDYSTGRPLNGIYFAVASGGGAHALRMTDMLLGGSSPTNGLKWMAIMACESLYQKNWNSMIGQGAKPYNSNLHMILGCATECDSDPLIGQYWADYMLGDPNQKPLPRAAMEIRLAWYTAAYYAYKAGASLGTVSYPNPMKFAVVSDPSCQHDTLQTNSVPSGGQWLYDSYTAFPTGDVPQ